MTKVFKPLLAATMTNHEDLVFPYMASPKLDGFRCLIVDGKPMSRNLKPIKNKHVNNLLSGLPDLDGELIVGSPTGEGVFNRTSSGVTRIEGRPNFTYFVFDRHDLGHLPFHVRYRYAEHVSLAVSTVPHILISNILDMVNYETKCLELGYEGIMLRDPQGAYKHGRSTPAENILLKVKRFTDGEMRITGVLEGQKNLNVATVNALGETSRSTEKAGMMPNGQVGTILGVDLDTGEQVTAAAGRMNATERKYYWENPEKLMGKIAKYKYFSYGQVDKPRFTTFQGFRHEDDL